MLTFKPRRAAFDLSKTPLHWFPGDAQTTHTFDVLHLLLPAGERWFVQVFKEALPHVADPELKKRMKAFMGQEEIHARAHEAGLEHLRRHGVDPAPFLARLDRVFDRVLAPEALGGRLPARGWLVHRLGVVAAIEHLTCVLATWLWANEGRVRARGADPQMLELLLWHASEEVEHRSVAFEAWRALGGTAAGRTVAMAQVFPLMTYAWVRGTAMLMRADATAGGGATWRHAVGTWLSDGLPSLPWVLGQAARYVKPGHHPDHEDTAWPLARAFLERYEARLAA